MAKSTLTIRAKQKGDYTEVRVTIEHPMSTEKCNPPDEALYIQEVRCKHNGDTVMTCLTGPGIATDPYFAFRFNGGEQGDKINISWVDNKGNKDDLDAKIY